MDEFRDSCFLYVLCIDMYRQFLTPRSFLFPSGQGEKAFLKFWSKDQYPKKLIKAHEQVLMESNRLLHHQDLKKTNLTVLDAYTCLFHPFQGTHDITTIHTLEHEPALGRLPGKDSRAKALA